MTTVFSNRFPISPSVQPPTEQDWKTVRTGVESLRGDVAESVRGRIATATADGRVSAEEYFARDAFSLGGVAIGGRDGSVQGAMKTDVRVGGVRAGKVDPFDVEALRQLLAAPGVKLDDRVRADAAGRVKTYDDELGRGVIQAGTHVDKTGAIHEIAEGRINVDYDTFVKRMNPADWSPNLPRYRGGEVRELGSAVRADGVRETKQQERMSLDSFPNNLDMTKNSITEVGPDSAKVSWHVFHSDPTALTLKTRSVIEDDGYIEFKKARDGKVLVRTHSKHKISTPGTQLARFVMGERLTGEIAGQVGLAGYFKDVVKKYRDIGEGRAEAVPTTRNPG